MLPPLHSGTEAAFNGPVVRSHQGSKQTALKVPAKAAGCNGSFQRPFLKWAGGKTQLLPQFARLYPPADQIKRYVEPFLGGGAVFFHVRSVLNPEKAVLWDNNEELIATFRAVRDEVEEVICRLRDLKRRHAAQGKTHYLKIRAQRPKKPASTAARLIYLNKTCFNGLYRVNSRGEFNVPMGCYKNPAILDEDGLREASRQLKRAEIDARDFKELPRFAKPGDFVYLDPPYHPMSSTSYFTSYTRDSFGEDDQRALSRVYEELCRKGCFVMLSNSDSPFINRLYSRFDSQKIHVHRVSARRNINSRAERRGPVTELVVVNYPTKES